MLDFFFPSKHFCACLCACFFFGGWGVGGSVMIVTASNSLD